MSYATPADFLARYDARIVGDIVADDGVQVSSSGLLTDPNLLASLADASGDVESACLFGERYTPDDLAALTGNSQSLLKRIVCDVAMAYLLKRRPSADPQNDIARLEAAERILERLRKGEQVFYRGDDIDPAGVIDTAGPTTLQLESLNTIRRRTQNYYPRGALPFNR